jgi:hypothetical protein
MASGSEAKVKNRGGKTLPLVPESKSRNYQSLPSLPGFLARLPECGQTRQSYSREL